MPRLATLVDRGPRKIWLGQAIAIEFAEPYIAEDVAHATRRPKTRLVV
jgi:hypothetical protein